MVDGDLKLRKSFQSSCQRERNKNIVTRLTQYLTYPSWLAVNSAAPFVGLTRMQLIALMCASLMDLSTYVGNFSILG